MAWFRHFSIIHGKTSQVSIQGNRCRFGELRKQRFSHLMLQCKSLHWNFEILYCLFSWSETTLAHFTITVKDLGMYNWSYVSINGLIHSMCGWIYYVHLVSIYCKCQVSCTWKHTQVRTQDKTNILTSDQEVEAAYYSELSSAKVAKVEQCHFMPQHCFWIMTGKKVLV